MECDDFTDQEQISFLEDFIREINHRIDKINDGCNYPREIKALKLRISVLECEESGNFKGRIDHFKEKLAELEEVWAEKEPIINLLEEERTLYRNVLNKI